MAFFRNSTVNLLNLHYGVHALALSGGGAFFTVFLLQAHVPAPAVLATIAAILIGRFIVRPQVLVFAKRWGLRPLVIAGTVITGLEYPLLAQVSGVGPILYVLVAVSAVGDTLYWTCYHAYFAALGDAKHRGHQISAREAIAALVGIIGPLAAGWALTTLGPQIAFGATAVVLLASALPIFAIPNVAVPIDIPPVLAQAWTSALMLGVDGWSTSFFVVTWQIALFISLGRSFTAFGGAMALAAVVGAICGLVLGRWIDLGHGRKIIAPAIAMLTLCVVSRAAFWRDPVWAVAANASLALVNATYTPVVMTAIYNQAQRSACTLRFHIACEAGWDLGGAAGMLTAAALLAAGAPFSAVILIALTGTAVMAALLWQIYGAAGAGAAPIAVLSKSQP